MHFKKMRFQTILLVSLVVTLLPGAASGASGAGAGQAAVQATVPAPVVANASLGDAHGAAALTDGTVAGWGHNKRGQVGDGTNLDQYVPKRVPGLPAVKQVAAAANASFALAYDGSVWAWGDGYTAYAGDNKTDYNTWSAPRKLDGIVGATAIYAGNFVGAALLNTGDAAVWYPKYDAKTGSPSIGYATINGLGSVKCLYVYTNWLYAIGKDGSVEAVNLYNDYYGRFRTEGELKIEKLKLPGKVGAIAAFNQELFLLQSDGSVLRYDKTTAKSAPVAGFDRLVDLKTAYNLLIGLRSNGTVWTWRINSNTPTPAKPEQVKGLAHIVAISGSYSDMRLAIQKGGKLFAWGGSAIESGTGTAETAATPGEWLTPITWQANGKAVSFLATSTVSGGQLYVPFASVFDALGIRKSYSVSPPDPAKYNATYTTWTFEYGGKTLSYRIANPIEVLVDGKPVHSPPPGSTPRPFMNATQFPLAYICETLGITFSWDRATGIVTLDSRPAKAT